MRGPTLFAFGRGEAEETAGCPALRSASSSWHRGACVALACAKLRPVPVLDAQDLQKSYGLQQILRGVTLTIRTGERVGLVGNNGSGKSTLARILGGVEAPDGGTLSRRRGAEVAYLDQDPTFDPALTPRLIVEGGLRAWSDARARHERASAALAKGHGDLAEQVTEQEQAA